MITGYMTVYNEDAGVVVAEDAATEVNVIGSDNTEEDTALDLLADHEYRLCMLELGGEV